MGSSRHVLLINSDRLEPVRILGRTPHVRLYAITKPKYAHLYRDVAEVRRVTDVAHTSEVIDAAALLIGRGHFDAVVTPLERSVISGGFVRSYLDIQGMGLRTAAGFANKLIMKRRLAAVGLPVADFRPLAGMAELRSAGEEIGWPVVVKPAVSAGTQHTYLIADADEAAGFSRTAAGKLDVLGVPFLAERYIPMSSELHADAVVWHGRSTAFSASRYFVPLLSDLGGFIGSYTLQRSDHRLGELRTLHDKVVDALGMSAGITHFEAYETADGLMVGEITCRPGGGGVPTVIQRKHGWNIWQALVDTSMGLEPDTTGSTTDDVVGWCGLPGRNGRIVRLSSAEELSTVPGIVEIDMTHRLGQVVQEKITSTFNAGVAYFSVPDYAAAEHVRTELAAKYTLECAPS